MNHRLGKKKRLGLYQELGFNISADFTQDCFAEAMEKFFYDFIDMIEVNRLVCGGGMNGQAKTFGVFVGSDIRRGNSKRLCLPVTPEQRQIVADWCRANPIVRRLKVSELKDAWHGFTKAMENMTHEDDMVGSEVLR